MKFRGESSVYRGHPIWGPFNLL